MADSDPASAAPSGTASPKEDAATKSAREELKHTVISEKADAAEEADVTSDHKQRAITPDTTPQLKPGQHDTVKEQVSSPKKKRAHDQVDDDDTAAAEGNKKNKDEHDQNSDDADTPTATVPTITSSTTSASSAADAPSSSDGAEPDKKRLRDEAAGDANAAKDSADGKDGKAPAAAPTSAFASSGFAKLTSTASPFGALGGAGAAAKPSLFGASTANSTTSSSASPFGSLGAAAAKPATTPSAAAPAVTSPTLSFGGSGAASPFAGLQSSASSNVFGSAFGGASTALSTGFGGIGSGSGGFGGAAGASSAFGSALSGSTLTSFAKPGEAFKSDKPARPFGAPESEPEESGEEDSAAEEDENGDEGEGDDEGADPEEKTKTSGEEKKKRLQRVVIDDGETGEATLLQVRARMYYHDKDLGWKERGAGMLKVNVPEQCVEYDRDGSVIPASFDASTLGGDADADDDGADDAGSDDANGSKSDIGASAKPKAGSGLAALPQRNMVRLIMRQDSTHRVILNTIVQATTEFKDRQTLKATTVLFTAFEGAEAKPVTVQAKMNIANAKTFLKAMEGIQKELRGD
ncbi:dead deah box DNA helicase [Ophiostoma piceae UAMH 11346]|uniref:Dead deah box DNA helicase n=1 Tax=Ophiostoma piceae (strain UAMH 11346) TaxID=1262450 RepID=S3BXS3_OPHP1|nr:dead deah box DNA helicase [Ophiostoma piceae UAMH 11346]